MSLAMCGAIGAVGNSWKQKSDVNDSLSVKTDPDIQPLQLIWMPLSLFWWGIKKTQRAVHEPHLIQALAVQCFVRARTYFPQERCLSIRSETRDFRMMHYVRA